MHDAPTQIHIADAAAGEPASFASKTRLYPMHKLTRAHLALAARPQVAGEARGALAAAAKTLTEALGVPVQLEAKLVDATLHPFTHVARQAVFATFELDALGSIAVLELEPTAASLLLEYAAGEGMVGVPFQLTRIEEATLGWLVLAVLQSLRAVPGFTSRYGARLVAVHTDRGDVLRLLDPRKRHVGIALTLQAGERTAGARLVVPAHPLQAAVSALPEAPAPAAEDSVLAANVKAETRVGFTLLRQADADALRAGDVVLFPGVRAADGQLHGRARFFTNSFELRGELSPAGFTLTHAQPRSRKENVMSDNEPNLPVEVEVELARVHIPVAELGRVRVGAVIALHINAAQSVVLRIGDKAVARAELVEIEGEIGARVIAVL